MLKHVPSGATPPVDGRGAALLSLQMLQILIRVRRESECDEIL